METVSLLTEAQVSLRSSMMSTSLFLSYKCGRDFMRHFYMVLCSKNYQDYRHKETSVKCGRITLPFISAWTNKQNPFVELFGWADLLQGTVRIGGHIVVGCGHPLFTHFDCVLESEAFGVVHLETWPCTQKFIAQTTTKFGVEAFRLFVTFSAYAVLPPPTFLGTISLGKWQSLKQCSGCNMRMHRAGLLKAWSWFPSSTRAKTTVDQKSAWLSRFKFAVKRKTLALCFTCMAMFATVICWLCLHNR